MKENLALNARNILLAFFILVLLTTFITCLTQFEKLSCRYLDQGSIPSWES